MKKHGECHWGHYLQTKRDGNQAKSGAREWDLALTHRAEFEFPNDCLGKFRMNHGQRVSLQMITRGYGKTVWEEDLGIPGLAWSFVKAGICAGKEAFVIRWKIALELAFDWGWKLIDFQTERRVRIA